MRTHHWLKITGLFSILLFTADIVPAQTNDSIVRLEADIAELSLLPANDIPSVGTFWLVTGSNGVIAPFPGAPPGADSDNTYAMPNGAFLVDGTAGESGVSGEQLAAQMNAVSNLIVNAQTQATATTSRTMGMRAMDDSSPPFPGGGDGGSGTNDGSDGLIGSAVDYGTNLWIAQWNMASNIVTGIASNTLAQVEYELLTNSDLTTTNWGHTGQFFLGSDATNWTPLPSLAASPTNNLFFRLLSYASSDGSGLPDWWEDEFFGTNMVNPNALDSAGDGWSIYQKYALGVSPSTFYTPAAPQGLAANYNGNTGEGTVTWQPSPGPVTGYTLEKTDTHNSPTTVQNISLSATATNYVDGLSSDSPDLFNGNNYDVSYRLQANYSGGNSSWTTPIPLQQITVSASIVPATNGATYLVLSDLPTDAATIRLNYIQYLTGLPAGDPSFAYDADIPISDFTNGIYQLPPSLLPTNTDTTYLGMYVQSIDSNSNASASADVNSTTLPAIQPIFGMPFYDLRVQMKQNLIFQLRAATLDNTFHFFIPVNEGAPFPFDMINNDFFYPTNYAYAGFYQNFSDNGGANNYGEIDPLWPYVENYLYCNFVFDPTNVDLSGNLTTGVSEDPLIDYGPDFYVWLTNTPAYLFGPGLTNTPALLDTNSTRWLFYDQSSEDDGIVYNGMFAFNYGDPDAGPFTFSLPSGYRNWFGLPYTSLRLTYEDYNLPDGALTNIILYAGSPVTVSLYDYYSLPADGYNYIYSETAQPQFQPVEYDFWNPNVLSPVTGQPAFPLPGNPAFSTTNQSELLITAVGNPNFQVAGYAKLAVTNGYPGAYGYLGQYFSQAYETGTNGIATTTTTGILSPYGGFIATEPGQAALVTMPDIDTGERGTCMVYAVSLQLDKNHDGTMDLSFNGPDATSANSPFVFWCNNNYDRWNNDGIFNTPEQDDVLPGENNSSNLDPNDPDCNYHDLNGNRQIPCTRDLEDFARLWIGGLTSGLASNLPAGSTVTLSWGDIGSPNPNNPTIDLFYAVDVGSIGYLTNETTAAAQINPESQFYIGRIAPGQSVRIFGDSNDYPTHFIWCGVTNGTGQLTLTIADANSNVLAQTSAFIQIKDIKQMYERWTVGDESGVAPRTNAVLTTEGLPAGIQAFQYGPTTDPSIPYILHVHGYNMTPWAKDRFAETEYKRLYWQGYQGRFGAFNWPTSERFFQFGSSESEAWESGQGLLNKLEDLNNEYPSRVYLTVHSLGNVVAGEALRLATNQVANTYDAMQGAVSAHTYDPTTPEYTIPYIDDSGTPDCYALYWTNGAPCYFKTSAGAGRYVNFFNGGDFALSIAWLNFQDLKPVLNPGHSYDASDGTYYKDFYLTELFFPTNTYELFSDLIQSRSYALGEEANVGGPFSIARQIELDGPPYNFGTTHVYHSGEFRSDYAQRWQFWDQVLVQMGLKDQ
jgi:hypothetical protein